MERLSPDDIRSIHEDMRSRYGGLIGEYEPGLIDFMAEKPFSGFGEDDFYPGLFMKAAIYMEGFACHQYFCDANKRTGYMCAKVFLMLNEVKLTLTDDDLYETTLSLARKEIDAHYIEHWLESNSTYDGKRAFF
jgi:death on curing protein